MDQNADIRRRMNNQRSVTTDPTMTVEGEAHDPYPVLLGFWNIYMQMLSFARGIQCFLLINFSGFHSFVMNQKYISKVVIHAIALAKHLEK